MSDEAVSYRSDQEAFRTRLVELEASVAELEANVRELEALRSRAGEARRARDDLRALVRQIDRCRSTYESLGEVRIASPCKERWADMNGDERVRHCGRCDKNVYDLSSLTRDEVDRLVREREGSLCVRFFQRSDGTILTADCHNGTRRRRLQVLAVVAVGIVGVGVASAANVATERPLDRSDAGASKQQTHATVEAPPQTPRPLVPPTPVLREAMGGVGLAPHNVELEAQIAQANKAKSALEKRVQNHLPPSGTVSRGRPQ